LPLSISASLVVGGEINERAEHLEIGDKSIHLGKQVRVAVEVAYNRLGITGEKVVVIAVWISLDADVRVGVGDHLFRVRDADANIGDQLRGEVVDLQRRGLEERIA